jgi:hypothetical protein
MESNETVLSNSGGCGDGLPPRIDMDLLFLDREILAVLENVDLDGDEKWIHYYVAIEQYLYKRDPTFKSHRQFKFRRQEDRSGSVRYVLRPEPWYYRWRRYSILTSLLGPLLGAVCSAILRGTKCC